MKRNEKTHGFLTVTKEITHENIMKILDTPPIY